MIEATTTHSPGVQEQIRRGEAATRAEAEHRAAMRRKRFDTIAVHGLYGVQAARANQGSIVEPLYLSTAEAYENSDHMEAGLAYLAPAWIYSRVGNPTVRYLEETLALLEGYGLEAEVRACATASGMAAIFAATDAFLGVTAERTQANGRGGAPNFVASANCYGGTFLLFSRYAQERGVEVRWVTRPRDLDDWARQMDGNTRFVYGEMPSNPGLAVFDVEALAGLAHSHGVPLIVDATVATPALLRPLGHGADIVVHSLTKSIGASGFAIAGAVLARPNIASRVGTDEMRADFADYVRRPQVREHGPALSPFNALMVLNDLRTLRSRMDRLSSNAQQVAEFLAEHPKVEAVNYPGLPDSPLHELGARYMWLADGEDDYGGPVNRFGHLLSFQVRGGAGAARAAFDRLGMIWRATDLGRIKSVATIPAISTHHHQGEAGRALAEVPENLIRLSVGGEHPADVIADLDQALRGV